MSGKPAARQGDMTQFGGPIVQGSASVLIGAPSGVACSVCPGGLTKGSPVNPSLGAKVLPGETDLALPGPVPLVINRSYSSYRTPTPGPVGLFGPGWKGASDTCLQVRPRSLILNDNGGRSLHFEALSPGDIVYSRSESLWLARGGVAALADKRHALATLWQTLPDALREDNHCYFVANSPQGPWWVFGYVRTVPAADAVLPEPLPVNRPLVLLQDKSGHQLRYLRDVDGEFAGAVTGVVDGAGRRYRFELTKIVSPFTGRTGYGQNSGIRLSAMYLVSAPGFADIPDTPVVRYEYSPRGELTAVYDRAGVRVRQFEWHPDFPGRMVAHRYAGRPASTYIYNADGKVSLQRNPGGLDYLFEYEKSRTIVTDTLNRKEIYHFTGEGGLRRLVKHERADGSVTRSEYDGAGRLTATVDGLGRKTEYDLDVATGSLCGITFPDGRQIRYAYNRQHQLIRTVFPDKTAITREFDDADRLLSQTDALNQTTRYHYADEFSEQVIAVELPDGARQQLEWTPYGQLRRYTDCSGNATAYDHDLWGQVITITHEEGLLVQHRYDARGRLVRTENNAGGTTEYRYNEAGDRVRTTFPGGQHEDREYDERGHLQRYLNNGLVQRFSHDAAGRLLSLTNENGALTRFEYDVMDRLVQESGFDGRRQQYRYNAGGELIRSEDMGLTTDWVYDEGGRVRQRVRPPLPDGSPDEEHWSYTPNGLLQEVWHYSEGYRVIARWQRDRTGRVIAERQQVISPDEQALWTHTIGHQFQARGGLAQTLPDGLPAIDWLTYGPGYLLGVAVGGKPVLEFERDKLHRERRRGFGPLTRETHYDRAGRLAGLSLIGLPDSPLNRMHQYDTRGQLVSITNGAGEARHFIYDGIGRLTEEQGRYPAHYQYDPAGNRLPPLHDPLSALYTAPRDRQLAALPDNRLHEDAVFTCHYDVYGNLSEKVCKASENEVHRYEYDRSHRLTHYSHILSWRDGRDTTHGYYLYDPLGRRVGKRSFSVSPHGRLHEPESVTWYGWEGDRLVLTERNGQRIHTLYQPGSFVPLLRIEGDIPEPVPTLADTLTQESGIAFTPDVRQRLNQLEQELRDGQLSPQSQQWLAVSQLTPDRLLPLLKPLPEPVVPTVHLYYCDHLGTPLALLNQQGEADWQAEFDPWGNQVDGRNPKKLYQPIRMQGQHYDEETGLHYNRHRYYDPMLGRYITQDPIGLAGGMNSYAYVSNKPTGYIDPRGLAGWGGMVNLGTPGIKPMEWQPPLKPMMRSVSFDIGYSGSAFTGASDSYGIAVGGSDAGSIDYDICVYHTICDAEGIGFAVGGALTGAISESGLSSGESVSEGYTVGGGYIGDFTGTVTTDNSGNTSRSLGVGPGLGTFAGKITCNQSSHCAVEWIKK